MNSMHVPKMAARVARSSAVYSMAVDKGVLGGAEALPSISVT